MLPHPPPLPVDADEVVVVVWVPVLLALAAATKPPPTPVLPVEPVLAPVLLPPVLAPVVLPAPPSPPAADCSDPELPAALQAERTADNTRIDAWVRVPKGMNSAYRSHPPTGKRFVDAAARNLH